MSLPDLKSLGLGEWSGCELEIIADKPELAVYRLTSVDRTAVLKLSKNEQDLGEAIAYRLLQECGVPTLRIYDAGSTWILIEDLLTSPLWRLATLEDVESEAIGAAVAVWYKDLHKAGTRLLKETESLPQSLKRDCDSLTPESVLATADRLGVADLPVWDFAAQHVERLKIAFQSYPETLNYNDFYWTNLALSRNNPMRAVVFDYHLLGIGPAWSDIRNVCGSLGPAAKEAFLAAYGEVDDSIAVFDRPLSLLYSLSIASHLDRLPGWAQICLEQVRNGELESLIRSGLDACD